ncbi:unnamed protein product, partial [marine sediment metagenome]
TMIVKGRQDLTHSVRIPGEDASKEMRLEFLADLQKKVPDLAYVGEGADMSNLYDRMGRPKEASEYALGDIPEALQPQFVNIGKKAHEMGLSDAQLKGLTETILTDFNSSMDIQAATMKTSKQEVASLYGDALADKLKDASSFAKLLGFDDNFSGAIGDGVMGLDNMKAFDKLMDGFESPGPRIGHETGGELTNLTPAQAEEQLSLMQNNKEHAFNNPADPLHAQAKAKFVELVRSAEVGKK